MDYLYNSYLFDPVQVPSSGYVNEVSSCKLEEDGTVRVKGNQDSQVLVQKNEVPREALRRTVSRSRAAGPPEPSWPHQGALHQGDTGGRHYAVKTSSPINGIGPTAALQPTGDPGHHQGGWGAWASTTNGVHSSQPFLDGGCTRGQDCVLPDSEEPGVVQNGDSRAPPAAECPAGEAQDYVLQIPAPDYPQRWDSAGDTVDPEEKDCLFKSHPEQGPLERMRPGAGEPGCNRSFAVNRSWDSLNEAMAAEALSVCFQENPAQAVPVVDGRNGSEDAHGPAGDTTSVEPADEDAEVAEALAALEAATAGEDVDEMD